jgi:hypothetical protein
MIVRAVECGEEVLLLGDTGRFRPVLEDANAIRSVLRARLSLRVFRERLGQVHGAASEKGRIAVPPVSDSVTTSHHVDAADLPESGTQRENVKSVLFPGPALERRRA